MMLSLGGSDYFTHFWITPTATYSFFDLIATGTNMAVPMICGVFILLLRQGDIWQLTLKEMRTGASPSYVGSWLEQYLYLVILYVAPVLLTVVSVLTILQTCCGVTL